MISLLDIIDSKKRQDREDLTPFETRMWDYSGGQMYSRERLIKTNEDYQILSQLIKLELAEETGDEIKFTRLWDRLRHLYFGDLVLYTKGNFRLKRANWGRWRDRHLKDIDSIQSFDWGIVPAKLGLLVLPQDGVWFETFVDQILGRAVALYRDEFKNVKWSKQTYDYYKSRFDMLTRWFDRYWPHKKAQYRDQLNTLQMTLWRAKTKI